MILSVKILKLNDTDFIFISTHKLPDFLLKIIKKLKDFFLGKGKLLSKQYDIKLLDSFYFYYYVFY